MLAPIMTKEMKLFPSQQLPSRVKNVRSRAQSLKEFYTASTNVAQIGGGGHGTANSLVLLHEIEVANGGGVRAVRQKSSKSIGHLPTNVKNGRNARGGRVYNLQQTAPIGAVNTETLLTTNGREKSGGIVQQQQKCSTSLASLKKPLDSIVEGVEMQPSSSSSSSKVATIGRHESTKIMEELKRTAAEGLAKSSPTSQQSAPAAKEKHSTKSREKKKHLDNNNDPNDVNHAEGDGSEARSRGVISSGCFTMWLRSSRRKKGKAKGGGAATEPLLVVVPPSPTTTEEDSSAASSKNKEKRQ
ncbi:hypothetical protein GPALN_006923 [Globodera pallida]|nr:hypothetical protein GPALN_006923 [Globodera pallida]